MLDKKELRKGLFLKKSLRKIRRPNPINVSKDNGRNLTSLGTGRNIIESRIQVIKKTPKVTDANPNTNKDKEWRRRGE